MDERPATLSEMLRSIAFYAAFFCGSMALVMFSIPILAVQPRRLRGLVLIWPTIQRWCVRHILGIRYVIEGGMPPGTALVAIKHESFFEAVDLPLLLPNPAVFAKVELMRLPLWGRYAVDYGMIPVERDQGARALRAMVSAARALSAKGRPIAIFPEGTRVRHGEAPPLQAGFAGLYKLLGLPVVPVAVDSGRIFHRLWKRRGTITIRFGAPIEPGLPREEIEARVRAAINALNTGEAT